MNPARLPALIADLLALASELQAALDADGDGGKKVSRAEWKRLGKRAEAVLGDLIGVLL